MAGCSGTDGINELHRAVRHRYVPVLWHRFGMGQHGGTVADRSNRAGGVLVSDAVQPPVAFRIQIRAAGMDMADADIREMAGDTIIKETHRSDIHPGMCKIQEHPASLGI